VDITDTRMPLSYFPQSLGKTSPLVGRTAALFRFWAMCLLLHQRRWWAPARGNEATPTTLSIILSASTVGCLQVGVGPLWVCEGSFDALALLAAGVARVVAIFGVKSWRWDWLREVRELVFALDADTAGQQQWRTLVRQAALRGKQVAVLPSEAGSVLDMEMN
jgi:Toprim-like